MTQVDTAWGAFTKPRYDQLVRRYNHAVKHQQVDFIFEEQTMLTGMVKYLIEYLDPVFKHMK